MNIRNYSPTQITISLAVVILAPSILETVRNPANTLNSDTALFHYSGWILSNGGIPYVDVWDVKPPITAEFLAIMELIFRSPESVIVAGTAITALSIVVSAALASKIVENLTNDWTSATLSGVMMFSYPGLAILFGFSPKIVFMGAGLAAIYLALIDSYWFAGGMGAIAAGLWQFAIVYSIASLILSWYRGGNNGLLKWNVSAGIVTIIVVSPIVLLGGGMAMITEVIFVPLLIRESTGLLRPLLVAGALDWAIIPVTISGALGLFSVRSSRKIQAATLLYSVAVIQVLWLDFDGGGDLYLLLSAAAILLGLSFNPSVQRIQSTKISSNYSINIKKITIILIVSLAITAQLVSFTGVASNFINLNASDQRGHNTSLATESVSATEALHGYTMSELYINRITVDSCHIRLSGPEQQWIRQTNSSINETRCGDLLAKKN